MQIFLDTEFTNLRRPVLLSIGMVTMGAGRELYLELDLTSPSGQERRRQASEFVRSEVLPLWGRVPGATATLSDMGLRAAAWLSELASESDAKIEVLFDYPADFMLLAGLLADVGQWERLQPRLQPQNIAKIVAHEQQDHGDELRSDAQRSRGLLRHHALGDAYALRHDYLAAMRKTERLAALALMPEHERMLRALGLRLSEQLGDEAWGRPLEALSPARRTRLRLRLEDFLLTPHPALRDRRPLDMLFDNWRFDLVQAALTQQSAAQASASEAAP